MTCGGNPAGFLGQMQVHRLRVAVWQSEADQKTVRGTVFPPNALRPFRPWDRSRQRCRGRRYAGPAGRTVLREGGRLPRLALKSDPSPGDLVLLTNTGLISKPHLYPVGRNGFFLRDGLKPCRDAFFEILDRTCRLRVVTRTGRELAGAHAAQFPAQGLPGNGELKFRQYPLAETCDPPAHHTVKVRCRPLFDPLRQRQAVRAIKDRHRPDPASPGAFRLIRPTGPEALNRSTGSRTICNVTPPIRAAALRVAPS